MSLAEPYSPIEPIAEQLGRTVRRAAPYAKQAAPYLLWLSAVSLAILAFVWSSSAFVGMLLDNPPERQTPRVLQSMPPTPVLLAAKAAEPERLGLKPAAATGTPQVIKAAAVAQAPAKPQMIAVVGLAVRAHPQKGSAQVAALDDGELVTVSGTQNGWVLVTTADGKSGWAYGKYLTPVDPEANIAADSPFWAGND